MQDQDRATPPDEAAKELLYHVCCEYGPACCQYFVNRETGWYWFVNIRRWSRHIDSFFEPGAKYQILRVPMHEEVLRVEEGL